MGITPGDVGGVGPTAYGRALLNGGTAVFDDLRQAVKNIEFLADPTIGEIRIGSNEAITGGLLSLGVVILRDALGLGNVGANYAGWATLNPFNPIHTPILVIINYLGWAILTVIGLVYLTGRSFSLPVPRVNAPQSLMNIQGYRGGFLYGVFIGGPGQAHCTVTILIPIVFLSLSTLDPPAVLIYFGLYTLGRIIPILVSGLMLQDMRLRFTKGVVENGKLINRLIGISFLIGGLVLFFWL